MTQLAIHGGQPIRQHPFASWPVFDASDEQQLLNALRSGKWGCLDGDQVAQFEQQFSEMHGCKHGIAVVNGTVSLRLALLAAGLQAEDEVIVPPYTFYATASAVVEANMIPVFADIDLDSFNLDPKCVESAVTSRTQAIIPVHFAGQPAEMDAINSIARKHHLLVVEDAAHAHGASWKSKPAGCLGDIASFSFQSSKNLTCGEGGMIVTNDDALAEKCRSLHNCGRIPTGVWYEHHIISANYRMGELQGALLNSQLRRLDQQTQTRDLNGRYLAQRLSQIPGLYPQRIPGACTRHSFHLFLLRLDSTEFGASRSSVLSALQAEGIPCSGGYGYSLNHQPLFRNKAFGPYLAGAAGRLDYQSVCCRNSDLICSEQAIWLGQSIFLGDKRDLDDIATAFEKIYTYREQLS